MDTQKCMFQNTITYKVYLFLLDWLHLWRRKLPNKKEYATLRRGKFILVVDDPTFNSGIWHYKKPKWKKTKPEKLSVSGKVHFLKDFLNSYSIEILPQNFKDD